MLIGLFKRQLSHNPLLLLLLCFRNYDIFAMVLEEEKLPAKNPQDYTENEIAKYRIGRLTSVTPNQKFIVGQINNNMGRIRRALGGKYNLLCV